MASHSSSSLKIHTFKGGSNIQNPVGRSGCDPSGGRSSLNSRTTHDSSGTSGSSGARALTGPGGMHKSSARTKPNRMHSSPEKQICEKEQCMSQRRGGRTKKNSGRIQPGSSGRCKSVGGYYSPPDRVHGYDDDSQEDPGYYDHGGRDARQTGTSQRTPINIPRSDPSRLNQLGSGDELYEISIVVYGHGIDPNDRSHWGFFICRKGDYLGDLLHVALVGQPLLYEYTERAPMNMRSARRSGRSIVATLNRRLCERASEIIRSEPAPRDGRRRCQDWVMAVMLRLETAELVSQGTSRRWTRLVGRPVSQLAAALGRSWQAFSMLT
jgi:hypothetical protein